MEGERPNQQEPERTDAQAAELLAALEAERAAHDNASRADPEGAQRELFAKYVVSSEERPELPKLGGERYVSAESDKERKARLKAARDTMRAVHGPKPKKPKP